MLIGVPKEIKTREYRVGLVPTSVRKLTECGHHVIIEASAGAGIGVTEEQYLAAGASIVKTAQEVFARAGVIVKVKEPQSAERKQLRPGQILFTYLHLAPDIEQARDLIASGATCIAYETVTSENGGLPLLAPMSEVAGRLSIQAGAHFLEKTQGGLGILLGGVTDVAPARVVVLGGGIAGSNAAQMALGLGAEVWVIDRNSEVLKRLSQRFGPLLNTAISSMESILEHAISADLLIGSVLIPGATAPKLISREIVRKMKKGSVIVDIAIDQGGCCETSRPTTHDDPVYSVDGVIHYCVANMPGAVPHTSTYALNNATLPFILALADKGLEALKDDKHLLQGLNVHKGMVTNKAVADALGYDYIAPELALSR
ncbi:MAG TPA: alanine dehydrogenase [Methylophilaceae bacterium]|jgi:alanine dehydrogenase